LRTPLEIAVYALKEIMDTEKSANFGWQAAQNMASISKRALQDISDAQIEQAERERMAG